MVFPIAIPEIPKIKAIPVVTLILQQHFAFTRSKGSLMKRPCGAASKVGRDMGSDSITCGKCQEGRTGGRLDTEAGEVWGVHGLRKGETGRFWCQCPPSSPLPAFPVHGAVGAQPEAPTVHDPGLRGWDPL